MTDSSQKPTLTSNDVTLLGDLQVWMKLLRDAVFSGNADISTRLQVQGEELLQRVSRAAASSPGNETLKRRVCEWSEIEEGTGKFNTCKPGESFHLTQGMDLYPFCHWCGLEIEVVTDDSYIHGLGTFPHSDGCLCSKCRPTAQKALLQRSSTEGEVK
jgi:hypothetical protein